MEEIVLFVMGYLVQLLASTLLLAKIITYRSIYGLSEDTQICLLLGAMSRFIWTLETRLIETTFAYLEILCSVLVQAAIVAYCLKYSDASNVKAHEHMAWYYIAPAAFIISFLVHPGEDWISMQILVAFTMYCEAMAMIPQLYIMRKILFVEPITSHYVGLMVIARLCRMVFWGVLFMQGEHFLQLFIADIMHTVGSGDYLMLWVKKLSTGGKLVYSL